MPVVLKKANPISEKDVTGFGEKENAIKALSLFIHGTHVTRGGHYLLNIINTLTENEKEISKRLPQAVFSGMPEGGRKNVQASAILRSQEGTNDLRSEQPSGYTKEQELIGGWAERDGCWSDTPEEDLLARGFRHNPDLDGSEARIFYNETHNITKTIDSSHYGGSLQELLDRISIHNAAFPESAMTVTGFGIRDDAGDNSGFVITVRQPFIQGIPVNGPEEIDEAMKARNLKKISAGRYTSAKGDIILEDLHEANCVRTSPEGPLIFFDCEARIASPVPPLDYSPEAVKNITETVREMLPNSISKEKFLGQFPEKQRKRFAWDLKHNGRIDGPVRTSSGDVIIETDPDDMKRLLVTTEDKLRNLSRFGPVIDEKGCPFSREEKKLLVKGKAVRRGNTAYAYSIDLGRIKEVSDRQQKLKLTQEMTIQVNF